MTVPVWLLYVGAFTGSFGLSLGLTPVARRTAQRLAIFDRPTGHKQQRQPVPYLGGAAIIVSFAVALMGAAALGAPASTLPQLMMIMSLGVGLSLVGLADDLGNLGPTFRIVLQLVAAAGAWAAGVTAGILPWEAANAAITIIWIVAIANAFNLLDNMDGLAAGVAAIAAASFFVLAAVHGQFLVAALALALAGCALGFLRHNFQPASIYMGDGGSLFLGFMLAVTAVMLTFDAGSGAAVFAPVLVLGVAIFDTALVIVTRIQHGHKPWSGGRDHTSHRLVALGLPIRSAVGLIYVAGVALGVLALVMARVDLASGVLLAALVVGLALVLGVLLGLVPVYATSRRRFVLADVALAVDEADEATEPTARHGNDHVPTENPSTMSRPQQSTP